MSRGRLIPTRLQLSMETKAAISRVYLAKGMYSSTCLIIIILTYHRFGWVNASYMYGLELLSAHMRRALGALTDWDSYEKAINDLGMA